jgi:CheY-like chemotaxis protein
MAIATQVMVVDDDDMNREIIEAFLVSEGYEVVLAHNGRQALTLLQAQRPALVLLDVRMPDMNGYEVCQQIKGNPQTRQIPVVMVTGYDSDEEKQRGQQAGTDAFMSRPFDGDDLLSLVNSLIDAS